MPRLLHCECCLGVCVCVLSIRDHGTSGSRAHWEEMRRIPLVLVDWPSPNQSHCTLAPPSLQVTVCVCANVQTGIGCEDVLYAGFKIARQVGDPIWSFLTNSYFTDTLCLFNIYFLNIFWIFVPTLNVVFLHYEYLQVWQHKSNVLAAQFMQKDLFAVKTAINLRMSWRQLNMNKVKHDDR